MKPDIKRRAVFLDRDGVIVESLIVNGKPYAVTKPEQLNIVSDARDSLERLKKAGFMLIVVTNQPDLSQGKLLESDLIKMHEILCRELPTLDDIIVCPHTDSAQCECRKPKPGMITAAAKKYSLDLSRSFVIGDRWRDIDAGKAANSKTIWIKTNYNERQPEGYDWKTDTLTEATRFILENSMEQ